MPVNSDVPSPAQVPHWYFAPQIAVCVQWGAVLPDTNLLKFSKGKMSGKWVCRKGPVGRDGHQADHEPAMGPCSEEAKQPPGLHWEDSSYQAEGILQLWRAQICSAAPQYKRLISILERIQQMSTKMIKRLERWSDEERLSELGCLFKPVAWM